MNPRLVLRLFENPEVFFDGQPVKWTALPRCYAILALLAGRNEAPHTRASLATSIWPDELDNEARTNLRRHLHSLNGALPKIDGVEWIVTDDRSIGWNDSAPGWIDVRAFEDAAADPARFDEALELYRGDLLESTYDDCVIAERERLRDVYVKLLVRLIGEARERRDFPAAVGYADKLLAADEWREDAVRAWIASTYEGGDRSGALAAYERFARRLREEFSTEPMAETTALRDAIRAGLPLALRPHDAFLNDPSESSTRAWKLPFAGRREAFEKLRSAWSRAARRTGSVAFVSGEAGIGKSRLAAELAALIDDQGGYVLVGRTSNPESEPYQAFVTALRPALAAVAGSGNVDGALLSAAAKVMPEIGHLRPSLAAPEALSEDRAQSRLFEAFVRLIEQASKVRPLCLVLEDLHWARSAGIELLGTLARRVGTLPILVVVTYRSEESTAGHPLRALRSALVAERRAVALSLGRLAREEIEALVHAVAGDADASLPERVANLSEGNPLFAAQLLESYRETGIVPDASSALRTIGDAIDARVRTFDAAVRSVAEVAATLGESFRTDDVANVGGWSENDVFDAVGTLIDRGLVRESGSAVLEYAFTHALVAASFYQAASDDVRIERHRRAAALLEREGDGDRLRIAEIARHWKLAGDLPRASIAYGSAARAALDVYARDAAIEYAREALAHATDPRARFELLLLIARACERSERLEERSRDLDELAALANVLDDQARYESLKAREQFDAQRGDREAQLRLIDEMIALARRAGSEKWRAEALHSLGLVQLGLGRFTDAIESLREGLAIAVTLDDRRFVSNVRRALVQTLTRSGDHAAGLQELEAQRRHVAESASIEERLDLAWCEGQLALESEDPERIDRIGREILALAIAAGDQETQGKAHFVIAWGAGVRRDFATVYAHYGEGLALFERLHQPQSMAAIHLNLGVFDFECGLIDRGIEHYEKAAALAESTGTSNVLGFALSNIADAYRARGDLDRALDYALRAEAVAAPTGDHRLIASTTGTLGEIRCLLGDFDAGLPMLREAIDLWRSSGSRHSLVEELRRLVEALIACGIGEDPSELDRAAAELTTLFEERPTEQKTPARIYGTLARVARLRGRAAAAKQYAEKACATFAAELARLPDEERRTAYRSMAHNREFDVPAKHARKGSRRQ